ncbi:response regulator [Maribacter litopenaei]|uniref:Response regulator n=1 Tax=Maribacter litopenaei TaxID=2976127 RepID=A0ABY5Y7D8_9FLAO|nr:response regulator [Maribacter litopenaei]UWX54938.1 response regulator [Maribacter litopenaei]
MKVLLIDDSEIDNYINKAIISKSDIVSEVVTKTSGREALDYLVELKEEVDLLPDIIFLDIRMPGMDGYEFIEHYKNLPSTLKDKCRVFVLSSSTNPTDVARSESYEEIEKHLAKPLAHHSIEKLIHS